jgi:hypothetical protein
MGADGKWVHGPAGQRSRNKKEAGQGKRETVIRKAGGKVWEDQSLLEWDPGECDDEREERSDEGEEEATLGARAERRAKRESVSSERSENRRRRRQGISSSPPKGGRDFTSAARRRRRLGRPKGVSSEAVVGRPRIPRAEREYKAPQARTTAGIVFRARRMASQSERAPQTRISSPPKGGRAIGGAAGENLSRPSYDGRD